MFLSYFKKFPDDDYQIEVIVEFPNDGEKTGNVVDVIKHPLNYIPKGEILYQKRCAISNEQKAIMKNKTEE